MNVSVVVFAILSSSTGLFAQGNRGGLSGNVTDSTEALIPDVKISLRSLSTNAVYSTVSTLAGYSFPAIPPGVYHLEAEKVGFKRFVRQPVSILTATISDLRIVMEIGSVSDSVTVSSDVLALQTTSAEVSTVMQRQMLSDLPLQVGIATGGSGRRQPEQFIFLTPGVQGTPGTKNVNGSPATTQEVLIDGMSAQLPGNPGFLAQTAPPYEAVEEFKMQNALYSAEFGRGLGVINYTLKSGTNQFHGTLFEFFRNEKLDARAFFVAQRPISRFHEYGGSAGGPILIPKLYNGKNRTFWNFNYTGLRNTPAPAGGLFSNPPLAFRSGDFSRQVDAAGALIPIFDPATTGPTGTRTPFAGNIIPQSRQSRVAQNVLALLPPPDLPGYFSNQVNRQANASKDWVWLLKADQILTDKQRLSFSTWHSRAGGTSTTPFGEQGGPFGIFGVNPVVGHNYRGAYDRTIRPNLLQNAGFAYTYSNPTRQRDPRLGNELIQLPGVAKDSPGFPAFIISNTYGANQLGNSNQQPNDPSANISYTFVNNFTWIKNRHQFKFGGEVRFMHFDNFTGLDSGGMSGTLNFSPLSTSNLTDPRANSLGNGYASLLLGQVFSAQRVIPAPVRLMRNRMYAWFIEDVFKVNRKLTMTIGVRHDVVTVPIEKSGSQSYLDLSLPNPGANGRAGALAFLKSGNRLLSTYMRGFTPRLSIAYAINPKTVLRTGFGMTSSPTNGTSIGRMSRNFVYGFSYAQDFPQLTSGREPALLLDNGFPAFAGTLPLTNADQRNGLTIDFMNPGANKPGYTSSWTFGLQRELPAKFLAEATYIGNKSVALPGGLENLNQVPAQYLSLGSTLNTDINSAAARAANIPIPYPNFRGSVAQALRPYPQFSGIDNLFQPTGWSTYNALQIRVQKNYSGGLSMLIAYTASKTMVHGARYLGFGDIQGAIGSPPLDTANRRIEKRLADFDSPQVLVLSWTYDLPFGAGKRFLPGIGRKVGLLLGGWQVSGIQRYASGPPLSVFGGGVIPLFGGGNRADRVPGVDPRTAATRDTFDPARDLYINSAAFAQPAPFTFGNSAANYGDLRAFSMFNEDAGILKKFRLFENHAIQFRAEMFNVLNRVVFSAPAQNFNAPANFGRIAGQSNVPRIVQLGLKYTF